jgi:hypothetical protein
MFGRGRGGVATAPPEAGPAIGAMETRVFDCPSCARPLTIGTSRCPGCGVRLIRGVALRRGGVIAAAAVGVILVGGLTLATMAIGGPAPAAIVGGPSIVPSAASTVSGAVPTASLPVAAPPAPVAAVSALSGTAVVNGRITVDAGTLATTLAAKNAKTIDIARALRSLAADAALGLDLTGRLGSWTDAAPTTTKLEDFYRTMAQTARLALRASLADAAGYRRAGADMLRVLKGLGEVDAASRALAATVGLELPPLPVPGSP